MCHALLRDTRFFELLYALDSDLADRARIQGCPCGGRAAFETGSDSRSLN